MVSTPLTPPREAEMRSLYILVVGTIALSACVVSGCNKKKAENFADCAIDPSEKPIMNAESAGCIIIVDGALLVERVAGHGEESSGKVTPPGGAVESGESARCSAVRQTYEETGLRVKAGKLFGVWRNNFHLFMCQLVDPADIEKARTPDVPKAARGSVSQKLLMDMPSMKNRKTGKKELWAFPTNVVISADWKSIAAAAKELEAGQPATAAASATPTAP